MMVPLDRGRDPTSSPTFTCRPTNEAPHSILRGTGSPTRSSDLSKDPDRSTPTSEVNEVDRSSRRVIDLFHPVLASDVVWMDPCRRVHPCLILRLVSSCDLLP